MNWVEVQWERFLDWFLYRDRNPPYQGFRKKIRPDQVVVFLQVGDHYYPTQGKVEWVSEEGELMFYRDGKEIQGVVLPKGFPTRWYGMSRKRFVRVYRGEAVPMPEEIYPQDVGSDFVAKFVKAQTTVQQLKAMTGKGLDLKKALIIGGILVLVVVGFLMVKDKIMPSSGSDADLEPGHTIETVDGQQVEVDETGTVVRIVPIEE